MNRGLLAALGALAGFRELPACPSEYQQEAWHREERLHHRAERKYWRRSLRLTRVVIVGAFASALFAGWAAFEGKLQVREAHRQADEAHRQAEIAQLQLSDSGRAWTQLELPVAEAISWRAQTSRDGSPDHGELTVVLIATNVGNSPAMGTRLYARSVIVSAIDEATNNLPSTLSICAEPGTEDDMTFRNTVFPRATRSQISKVSLGHAAFQSARGDMFNPSSGYIVVCAAYGVLGEGAVSHHTARVFAPMRSAGGKPTGPVAEPIRFNEQLAPSQIMLKPVGWGDEAD